MTEADATPTPQSAAAPRPTEARRTVLRQELEELAPGRVGQKEVQAAGVEFPRSSSRESLPRGSKLPHRRRERELNRGVREKSRDRRQTQPVQRRSST